VDFGERVWRCAGQGAGVCRLPRHSIVYKASALQPNKKAISSKKKDEIRRVNIVEEMR
jgi:hypothetical protein